MTTYDHIQELRAELRNAVYAEERRWIEAELEKATREWEAEEDAFIAQLLAEPPH